MVRNRIPSSVADVPLFGEAARIKKSAVSGKKQQLEASFDLRGVQRGDQHFKGIMIGQGKDGSMRKVAMK